MSLREGEADERQFNLTDEARTTLRIAIGEIRRVLGTLSKQPLADRTHYFRLLVRILGEDPEFQATIKAEWDRSMESLYIPSPRDRDTKPMEACLAKIERRASL